MVSNANSGLCAHCGDANAYTALVCSGCGARLPWADAMDALRHAPPAPAPIAGPLPPPAPPSRFSYSCDYCGRGCDSTCSYCPRCGFAILSTEDRPSWVLNLVAFLFPLLGFMAYLAFATKMPRKAQSIAQWMTWSFVLGVLLFLALTVMSYQGYPIYSPYRSY